MPSEHEKFEGERTLMRIHIGESDKWEGKPLYQDTADQQHKLTDASALATSLLSGIALNAGVDGRKIYIAPKGARINWGATLTAGTVYCAGPTAGEIVPWADLVATDFVCVLCTGEGTAEAEVIGATGGVAHA